MLLVQPDAFHDGTRGGSRTRTVLVLSQVPPAVGLLWRILVPVAGLEPARLSAGGFKPPVPAITPYRHMLAEAEGLEPSAREERATRLAGVLLIQPDRFHDWGVPTRPR